MWSGKKIFITGVSRGLGRALVDEFIKLGAQVWGLARASHDFLGDITSFEDSRFIYSKCDVCNREERLKVLQDLGKEAFLPDVVILNAGAATDDVHNGELDLNAFQKNFELNLISNMAWVNGFLHSFLARKSGVFVAISSLSIYRENHKNRIGYSASKAALTKVFENLRQQYFQSDIKFVTVVPGRMTEQAKVLGIQYTKAAKLIVASLSKKRVPAYIHFPIIQFFLTKVLQLAPDIIFRAAFFK